MGAQFFLTIKWPMKIARNIILITKTFYTPDLRSWLIQSFTLKNWIWLIFMYFLLRFNVRTEELILNYKDKIYLLTWFHVMSVHNKRIEKNRNETHHLLYFSFIYWFSWIYKMMMNESTNWFTVRQLKYDIYQIFMKKMARKFTKSNIHKKLP